MGSYRRKLVLTQGNVGATDVKAKLVVPRGGWLEIDQLITGPDDYAADRTLAVIVRSTTDEEAVQRFGNIATVDNERLHWGPLHATDAVAPNNEPRLVGGPWRVHGGDEVSIQALALAQNEKLSIKVRGLANVLVDAENDSAAGVTMVETEA